MCVSKIINLMIVILFFAIVSFIFVVFLKKRSSMTNWWYIVFANKNRELSTSSCINPTSITLLKWRIPCIFSVSGKLFPVFFVKKKQRHFREFYQRGNDKHEICDQKTHEICIEIKKILFTLTLIDRYFRPQFSYTSVTNI